MRGYYPSVGLARFGRLVAAASSETRGGPRESTRNGITPPRTGPLFCGHFAALLKFSKYNIIWPVMALACGSLHTVVTFVPNG